MCVCVMCYLFFVDRCECKEKSKCECKVYIYIYIYIYISVNARKFGKGVCDICFSLAIHVPKPQKSTYFFDFLGCF